MFKAYIEKTIIDYEKIDSYFPEYSNKENTDNLRTHLNPILIDAYDKMIVNMKISPSTFMSLLNTILRDKSIVVSEKLNLIPEMHNQTKEDITSIYRIFFSIEMEKILNIPADILMPIYGLDIESLDKAMTILKGFGFPV